MEYTEVIYLLTQTYTTDSIGNKIPGVPESKKVYAKQNNVSTKEFYNAVEVGITPSCEMQIRKSNYSGQVYVNYNNVTYHVIRTIKKGITDIVLVLEIKVGNK